MVIVPAYRSGGKGLKNHTFSIPKLKKDTFNDHNYVMTDTCTGYVEQFSVHTYTCC